MLEVESTPYPLVGGKDQQESAVVVFERVNMQSVGSYHCLDYITAGCKLLRSYGFGDKQGAIESENLWLSNLFREFMAVQSFYSPIFLHLFLDPCFLLVTMKSIRMSKFFLLSIFI
ncbi:MAG: hypothetical protein CR997_09615 [Acidobacteria bacterium]|nr:MAG: hypothetical protein CR997_09615 [Acidobacteriota bacterium]